MSAHSSSPLATILTPGLLLNEGNLIDYRVDMLSVAVIPRARHRPLTQKERHPSLAQAFLCTIQLFGVHVLGERACQNERKASVSTAVRTLRSMTLMSVLPLPVPRQAMMFCSLAFSNSCNCLRACDERHNHARLPGPNPRPAHLVLPGVEELHLRPAPCNDFFQRQLGFIAQQRRSTTGHLGDGRGQEWWGERFPNASVPRAHHLPCLLGSGERAERANEGAARWSVQGRARTARGRTEDVGQVTQFL